MSNSPYIFRNYRPSDFEEYVRFNIETEKLKSAKQRVSPQTLREYLQRPDYSPEQDMFVVETAAKIVGFASITPELEINHIILDCLVHPAHRRKGLSKKLLDHATRRARELKARVIHVNIGQNNEIGRKVLSGLSFRIVREFLELRLPLAEIELSNIPHHSFTHRHLQSGEEDKLAQIQNLCFNGTWGYNPNTAEDITYYLNLSHCFPRDVVLFCDGDKTAGYCWTKLSQETAKVESKGCIHMLGVDPDYRGKGLGRIALLTGLAYLKNNGARIAEIVVDSENKTARNLYKSVGFQKRTTTLWYEKPVD